MVPTGGSHYVETLREDLVDQSISSVRDVTRHQQQAFDTFISGDRERLHSFAGNFAKSDSDDVAQIQGKLSAFLDVGTAYTIVNLGERPLLQ